MHCWKLTIEYDGTRYSGWQEQRNANTVQGAVRAAASAVVGDRVELGGAGRTDAGVHALAQVAHLRTPVKTSAGALMRGINDRLAADINSLAVDAALARVNARHDAVLRSYVYQISTRRTAFGKKYVWWVRDRLDEPAMIRAASQFVGNHDFAAFSQNDGEGGSTIVNVAESRLERHGDLLLFRIAASHFLWKMVRRLTGTLVAAGRGQLGEPDVEQLLERGGDTAELTAPPSGLFLEQVIYSRSERRRPLGPAFAL
jgi:tRNA pseudouridine38-40 synthase